MRHVYGETLRIAIDAACEAGTLIRRESLQHGGPRGEGSHADVDREAEEIIRTRLLTATPRWSYRGEETGWRRGEEGHHTWLVDPNDGTAAFLQGYRGTATSIGLLRDSVPVLGVVHAYAASDNGGDLFAWAEGCGPMTRNGTPVERGPWAQQVEQETVAIVSQSADRAARANLELLAPGRYRAEPSIAYRLALAAAGEAELAIGLSGPGAWDYCGGHALVRGAGGTLVDEGGNEVIYTVDGQSATMHCFGGSPHLAGAVARQEWRRVFGDHRERDEHEPGLCRPRKGKAIGDNGLLRRVQGCWLGQLAGDALGSMVEFMSAREIRARHPMGLHEIGPSPVWDTLPGQPTDDSELALALARTLLHDGSFDAERVGRSYVSWRESRPFDCGMTIGRALDGMHAAVGRGSSLVEAAERHASQESEANGALMRQSPLAIWGHALDPENLDRIVRADTRLTHPSPVCQDASAACIVALAAVIREGLDGEGAYGRALAWNRAHGRSEAVTQALEDARTAPPPDFSHNAGHVLIALQNAFYQALHASSLEEGVVATVMAGGDTDTNGAIAGALLGTIHGSPAVPFQWREAILTCRPQNGLPSAHQPRPQTYWPVDALLLSELLAVIGGGSSQ